MPLVYFGTELIKTLNSLPIEVQHKAYEHFILPINNGNEVINLEGKYKPSWVAPLTVKAAAAFKQAMVDFARENNLHHYHFGYESYKDGQDPVYSGRESKGILHTIPLSDTEHAVFRIDSAHPKW